MGLAAADKGRFRRSQAQTMLAGHREAMCAPRCGCLRSRSHLGCETMRRFFCISTEKISRRGGERWTAARQNTTTTPSPTSNEVLSYSTHAPLAGSAEGYAARGPRRATMRMPLYPACAARLFASSTGGRTNRSSISRATVPTTSPAIAALPPALLLVASSGAAASCERRTLLSTVE